MVNKYQYANEELILKLKEKYFCNKQKVIFLKEGENLLHQGQPNKRLFMVMEGAVTAFLQTEDGQRHEIFHAEKNMLAGVHSFFSRSFLAHTDVIADKDSKLAYIEYNDFKHDTENSYAEDFVPLIVYELSTRQLLTKELTLKNEIALKKLYQSDKLATLGQMAAGLAHELNNAIGVMSRNSEWVAQRISEYFKELKDDKLYTIFNQGLEKGQYLSSNKVREHKRFLEKEYNMPAYLAKKFAKIGMGGDELNKVLLLKNFEEQAEELYEFWEMGVAIHDTLLGSKHAVHVLKSIKQLSVSDQARQEIDLNMTIREAMTLLKNLTLQVQVNFVQNPMPPIVANNGELVQIWVNIIKNACESMLNHGTKNPRLKIESQTNDREVRVSITNNGPNIPEEMLGKIFQPNFSTKKGGLSFGLGLGLSIVQRLVDSYDGRISVRSRPEKTTFKISIPRAKTTNESLL